MANYVQKRKRAHRLIKKHGAPFRVERAGRVYTGFAVEDNKLQENRGNQLGTQNTATFYSTIELVKGDILYFKNNAQDKKQIDNVTTLQPDGDVIIYWEASVVR